MTSLRNLRKVRRMKRVESFNNTVNAINKRSGQIATDGVMAALLIEITGSLAVIADVLAEKKEGENHDQNA